MNQNAERHLTKARDFLERGNGYYRKAAAEIVAAQEADPTLGQREIAEWFGRSHSWVSKLVKWSTSGIDETTPFSEAAGKPNRDLSGARKVLREAPLEQVEQIVSGLPPERQRAVAAAAGDAYHKARQDHTESESRRTESERQEGERAGESLARPLRNATAGFTALGIVGHLEQATEELRELNADASVSPEMTHTIEQALGAFTTELDFAKAMLGEDAA